MKTGLQYWLETENKIIKPPQNEMIMVVSAHPDDIESECAGTIALAKDNNCSVRLLLVTSGDNGTRKNSLRENEAIAASKIFGVEEVVFLRVPDGEVENTKELREKIVWYVRQWKPSVVFTYDPEFSLPLYISHPDHRAVGRATLDSVYPLARDKNMFPEQLKDSVQPHIVKTIWMFASANATNYIDIEEGFERKVNARLEHKSQMTDREQLRKSWKNMSQDTGKRANLEYGEAFTIISVG